MACLFKVAPVPVTEGSVIVAAKPYRRALPEPGERIFLWWTEDADGRGLSGFGECIAVATPPGLVQATVRVGALDPTGVGFGKAQLAPLRDTESDAPEATLSKKLFRQAHNKVIALTSEEEAFLDTHF